jgi:hypothetical protein
VYRCGGPAGPCAAFDGRIAVDEAGIHHSYAGGYSRDLFGNVLEIH